MTIADVHAIALLACPAVAVVAIVVSRRRPSERPAGLGELLFPLGVALAANLTQHGCEEPAGAHQTLIPLVSMWAVFFWTGPIPVRWVLALGLSAGMLVLTQHAVALVHTDAFTGISELQSRSTARVEANRALLSNYLRQFGETDHTEYEAGWLRELPFADDLAMLQAGVPHFEAAIWCWHTRFTGLYGRDVKVLDYWYPGGRIHDASCGIEVRGRPDAPLHMRASSPQ